jgi:hypothetical protein
MTLTYEQPTTPLAIWLFDVHMHWTFWPALSKTTKKNRKKKKTKQNSAAPNFHQKSSFVRSFGVTATATTTTQTNL